MRSGAIGSSGREVPAYGGEYYRCVLYPDREFRFTYLNQKAAEILGGTAEDYLGEVIWGGTCSVGFDSPFARQYRKAAESQEKLHFEEFLEPANQWLEVHVYPSSEGLTVYFSDVTVQRQERAA